jgi:hypothetical protein
MEGEGEGGVSLTSVCPSAPACSITENIKYMRWKGEGREAARTRKTGDCFNLTGLLML